MNRLGIEIKDLATAVLFLLGMAIQWGATQSRMAAFEKAVEPVPQLRIDVEVVKAAVLDIRDDLRSLNRNRRTRE